MSDIHFVINCIKNPSISEQEKLEMLDYCESDSFMLIHQALKKTKVPPMISQSVIKNLISSINYKAHLEDLTSKWTLLIEHVKTTPNSLEQDYYDLTVHLIDHLKLNQTTLSNQKELEEYKNKLWVNIEKDNLNQVIKESNLKTAYKL